MKVDLHIYAWLAHKLERKPLFQPTRLTCTNIQTVCLSVEKLLATDHSGKHTQHVHKIITPDA